MIDDGRDSGGPRRVHIAADGIDIPAQFRPVHDPPQQSQKRGGQIDCNRKIKPSEPTEFSREFVRHPVHRYARSSVQGRAGGNRHRSQSNHERIYPEQGNRQAVDHADHRAGDESNHKAHDDRERHRVRPDVEEFHHRQGYGDAGQRDHCPDRQIEAANDQHHHLADRDDHQVGRVPENVDQVGRSPELWFVQPEKQEQSEQEERQETHAERRLKEATPRSRSCAHAPVVLGHHSAGGTPVSCLPPPDGKRTTGRLPL